MKVVVRICIEAAAVVALSGVVAAVVNGIRADGLPWIATEPYEVFVPCPEPLGEVEPVPASDPLVLDARTLRVDARDAAAFAAWHLPDARHLEFDWVSPVPDAALKQVAASGAAAVVVYGDGGDPDSGRELARELAGRGIRNVRFVSGGAAALKGGAQ